MNVYFVILFMLFCHIIDDFILQSAFLSNGKQKQWWEKNAPDELYKYDFLVCLIMHSISWTFSIMFPIFIYCKFHVSEIMIFIFIMNAIIHGVTDHLKANCHMINLIQDQIIHIMQIIMTFILLLF